LTVSRRLPAQINRNVEYPPGRAKHQFGVIMGWQLKVQSTQNPVLRHGVVLLGKIRSQSMLSEPALMKGLNKTATLIAKYTGLKFMAAR
jgi:hypothetical protein